MAIPFTLVRSTKVTDFTAMVVFAGLILIASSAAAQNPPNPDRNANWAMGIASANPKLAWSLFEQVTAVNANGYAEWETWKSTGETYLPNGAKPEAWGTPPPLRILDSDGDGDGDNDGKDDIGNTLSGGVHLTSTAGQNFVDGGLRDLKGRPIYGEIRLNKTAFEAVVANELYSVEGQLAMYASGQNFSAPDGSMEVKVTWRILDDDEDPTLKASYLTSEAIAIVDGVQSSYTLGMTGMNIIFKQDGAWFATAFEHIANPFQTLDDRYPHVALSLRVPAPFVPVNASKQSEYAGSPLGSYFSVGGQNTFVASDGGPVFLTNTQQETQIVRTSSCLSCHAYSAIARVDGKPTRLSPLVTANEDGTATGYFGTPDAAVLDHFTTFDMFWSMIEAQPQNPDNKTRMITVAEFLARKK